MHISIKTGQQSLGNIDNRKDVNHLALLTYSKSCSSYMNFEILTVIINYINHR